MALTLMLGTPSAIPLEVDAIQLDAVRRQSPAEVQRTLIQRGNRQVPLGEFFDAAGSAAEDATLVWSGDCEKVKLIGARLNGGMIRVEGNAGMHLGAEMTAGEILVEGNASDWVGAELHGGRIRVRGNAGHLVGAVYRGGRRGMTGGEILIDGDTGNEIGHAMRRGLIAVGGRTGDFAGAGMIAGTIVLCGETGIRHGAGMKRGTVALLSQAAPFEPVPTFEYACAYQPTFLNLYLHELRSRGFPVPARCMEAVYHRFCGDLLESGKGELLIRAAV
jgi:formylmethanofuran dehydrogenase subunit C